MKCHRFFGFTLIELIVVIGVIGILATIVILAINPARQFAKARNTTRRSDVRAIYNAVIQHGSDNKGQITTKITATHQIICNGQNGSVSCDAGTIDLYPELAPTYVPQVPHDPKTGSDANTRYEVYLDDRGKVVVVALDAELNEVITSDGAGAVAEFAPSPSPTLPPQSAKFIRANSEYLSNTNPASLPGGAEADFSFAGWVYLDAVGLPTKYIISLAGAGATGRRFSLAQNDYDSRMEFTLWFDSSTNVTVASPALSAGQWYFVVAWYDAVANTANIQLNNGAVSSASYAGGISSDAVNLYIGAYKDSTGYFGGRIDNSGLWGRKLTSTERTDLYNTGSGRKYTDLSADVKNGLVSFWNFDEESGTRSDAHGSNNLTDNNTVTFGPGV